MPTVTTAELVDRAKAVSDMRDNFVTPTQWMYWASQERLALDLFIARSGWPLPLSDFNIDLGAVGASDGQYIVNPTGGVMAIVCVYQYDTSGRIRMLQNKDAFGFLNRVPGTGPTGHSSTYRVQWSPSGDNLVLNLAPTPGAGETYRVVYVAHPKKLTLGTPGTWEEASVSYPLGWEERIILGMARRALMKEESDTRTVDQEIGLCEQRIEEAAWNRVLTESPSVRNTDPQNYGWTDRLSYPPYSSWTWL